MRSVKLNIDPYSKYTPPILEFLEFRLYPRAASYVSATEECRVGQISWAPGRGGHGKWEDRTVGFEEMHAIRRILPSRNSKMLPNIC